MGVSQTKTKCLASSDINKHIQYFPYLRSSQLPLRHSLKFKIPEWDIKLKLKYLYLNLTDSKAMYGLQKIQMFFIKERNSD